MGWDEQVLMITLHLLHGETVCQWPWGMLHVVAVCLGDPWGLVKELDAGSTVM